MKFQNSTTVNVTIDTLEQYKFLTSDEINTINCLTDPNSDFASILDLAETIHLHIKVENTDQLPSKAFCQVGASLDYQKTGFVKYHFPGAINVIFSHIKVSQDELLETEENHRSRPFLDHIGIDLREETPVVRGVFTALPDLANRLNWDVVSQGGADQAVHCCHVEVSQKHWLYPPSQAVPLDIPIEFAYGALKVNSNSMGCDLRPMAPSKKVSVSPSCCQQ